MVGLSRKGQFLTLRWLMMDRSDKPRFLIELFLVWMLNFKVQSQKDSFLVGLSRKGQFLTLRWLMMDRSDKRLRSFEMCTILTVWTKVIYFKYNKHSVNILAHKMGIHSIAKGNLNKTFQCLWYRRSSYSNGFETQKKPN